MKNKHIIHHTIKLSFNNLYLNLSSFHRTLIKVDSRDKKFFINLSLLIKYDANI